MATDVEPRENSWYYDRDRDRWFEVIMVDESEKRIELQDFDGDLDEIGFDAWASMTLEPAEPPEEWLGPMDNVGDDDLGYNDTDYAASLEPSAMDRYRREQVEWARKAGSREGEEPRPTQAPAPSQPSSRRRPPPRLA